MDKQRFYSELDSRLRCSNNPVQVFITHFDLDSWCSALLIALFIEVRYGYDIVFVASQLRMHPQSAELYNHTTRPILHVSKMDNQKTTILVDSNPSDNRIDDVYKKNIPHDCIIIDHHSWERNCLQQYHCLIDESAGACVTLCVQILHHFNVSIHSSLAAFSRVAIEVDTNRILQGQDLIAYRYLQGINSEEIYKKLAGFQYDVTDFAMTFAYYAERFGASFYRCESYIEEEKVPLLGLVAQYYYDKTRKPTIVEAYGIVDRNLKFYTRGRSPRSFNLAKFLKEHVHKDAGARQVPSSGEFQGGSSESLGSIDVIEIPKHLEKVPVS